MPAGPAAAGGGLVWARVGVVLALLGLMTGGPAAAQADDGLAALQAAQRAAAVQPQRGLAQLRALRQSLTPDSPLAQRLALDDAECRVLSDIDSAQAFTVADAGLQRAGANPAPPARAPWLRLRACRAGMLVELGRTTEAVTELQRLADPALAAADPVPRAIAVLERGVYRSRAGQLEAGQHDLLEACAVLAERSGSADRDLCLSHLANHYRRVGDLDEAMRLLLSLRDAARDAGAIYDEAIYTYSIGQILQEQGQWPQALASQREAAQAYRRMGDHNGLAYAGVAIANALLQFGRHPEALAEVTQALSLLDRQSDPRQFETGSITRAEVLVALGRHAQALAVLDTVGEALRQRNNPPGLAMWQRVRARAFEGQARWREAYQALAEARRIEEQVQAGRLSRQSAALRMQFNRQRDADELATLRQLNDQGQRLRQVQALALALSVALAALLLALVLHKRRQARRLQTLAATDELTGLLNRRSWLAQAEQALAAARRTQAPVSVLMIDVDYFKRVNDTRGHAVGDEVLRHVASLLAARLRAHDVLGRIGGEEFVVVMPDTTVADAVGAAERMREALARTPLARPSDGGAALLVSASFGVAPSDGREDTAAVLARADQALYAAKHAGRNRVVVADGAGPPPAPPAAGVTGAAQSPDRLAADPPDALTEVLQDARPDVLQAAPLPGVQAAVCAAAPPSQATARAV